MQTRVATQKFTFNSCKIAGKKLAWDGCYGQNFVKVWGNLSDKMCPLSVQFAWYCLILAPPTPCSHNGRQKLRRKDKTKHSRFAQILVVKVYRKQLIYGWIGLCTPGKSRVCKWRPHITWSGHKQRLGCCSELLLVFHPKILKQKVYGAKNWFGASIQPMLNIIVTLL